MQPDYSIVELCEALEVTRSGYHAWRSRSPGPRAQADARLLPLITQAHQESRQTYGSPRITRWLRQQGHPLWPGAGGPAHATSRPGTSAAATVSPDEPDRQ